MSTGEQISAYTVKHGEQAAIEKYGRESVNKVKADFSSEKTGRVKKKKNIEELIYAEVEKYFPLAVDECWASPGDAKDLVADTYLKLSRFCGKTKSHFLNISDKVCVAANSEDNSIHADQYKLQNLTGSNSKQEVVKLNIPGARSSNNLDKDAAKLTLQPLADGGDLLEFRLVDNKEYQLQLEGNIDFDRVTSVDFIPLSRTVPRAMKNLKIDQIRALGVNDPLRKRSYVEDVDKSKGEDHKNTDYATIKQVNRVKMEDLDNSRDWEKDIGEVKDFLRSGKIDSKLAEAFHLRKHEGISYEDLADIQGITPGTARKRVCEGLKIVIKEFPELIQALKPVIRERTKRGAS